MAPSGYADGISLVAMKPHAFALRSFSFADSEDLPALLVQQPLVDQVVDPSPGLECRVELNQWLGPKEPFSQAGIDILPDFLIADIDEARDVRAVIVDNPSAQIKNVHEAFPQMLASMLTASPFRDRKRTCNPIKAEEDSF